MRIKEITYGLTETIAFANYENIKPLFSATMELSEEDDVKETTKELKNYVNEQFGQIKQEQLERIQTIIDERAKKEEEERERKRLENEKRREEAEKKKAEALKNREQEKALSKEANQNSATSKTAPVGRFSPAEIERMRQEALSKGNHGNNQETTPAEQSNQEDTPKEKSEQNNSEKPPSTDDSVQK